MKRNAVRYDWKTREGLVESRPSDSGRYEVFFRGENLGSYHSPEAAADDVAGGHTFMPSDGTDLGMLGISHDLSEWERIPSPGNLRA